jgi:hypothetical protein
LAAAKSRFAQLARRFPFPGGHEDWMPSAAALLPLSSPMVGFHVGKAEYSGRME